MNPTPTLETTVVYRERITDEICNALGFARSGLARRLLGLLFRVPAQRFGQIAAKADDEVTRSGISGGARVILPDFSLESVVRGAENIPTQGPLLVVSNHPGGYDSVVIMASIPRKDLKIVISDVPFTRTFATARQYFIYVPADTTERTAALRASIEHLKSGGALLIFAHGDVEPDPELSSGAREAIQDWSRSVEVMLRKVPQTWLQVTIASGVLMSKFVNSPLVKIRKTAPKRQKLAEFLQISTQMVAPRLVHSRVRISFAAPVQASSLPQDLIMPTVIRIAQNLLDEHMQEQNTYSR
jgi:hypothetical protein